MLEVRVHCSLPCPLQIYQDSLAHSNTVAEEGFTLSRLVRAFGTEAATGQRYDGTLRTLRHISIRQVSETDALAGWGRL